MGGRKDKGEMRLSILLVVLMLFFSFPSFFYGEAEAQDGSLDNKETSLLIILASLGILIYFFTFWQYHVSITGKLTLILLLFWTFFWIFVAGVPVVNGDLEGSIMGIIIYIVVGIPSTLFFWFLWLHWYPGEKRITPIRITSKIVPAIKPVGRGKILRRGKLPIMGKFKLPIKRTVRKQPLKQKSEMEPIHLLRCGNIACRMEKFLVTEADGQQYCTKCGWKKR